MNKVIDLTPQPITITAVASQPLFDAADLLGYDMFDIQLGIIATTGTQTSDITFGALTGSQTSVDDSSWIPSGSGSFITGTNYPAYQLGNETFGYLRYLRWSLTSMGGLTSITFTLRLIARSRGGK